MCNFHKMTACAREKSGLLTRVLVGCAGDISATPKSAYQLNHSTSGYTEADSDRTTLGENFTFASGTGFVELYGVVDTVGVETASIGENFFSAVEHKIKCLIPGTTAANRSNLQKMLLSGCGLIVLTQKFDADGAYECFGTKESPVTLKISGGTGLKPGDKNGFELEFMTHDGGMWMTLPSTFTPVTIA